MCVCSLHGHICFAVYLIKGMFTRQWKWPKTQGLVAFAPFVYTRMVCLNLKPGSRARTLKTLSFVSVWTGSAVFSDTRCECITLSAHRQLLDWRAFSVSIADPCEFASVWHRLRLNTESFWKGKGKPFPFVVTMLSCKRGLGRGDNKGDFTKALRHPHNRTQ